MAEELKTEPTEKPSSDPPPAAKTNNSSNSSTQKNHTNNNTSNSINNHSTNTNSSRNTREKNKKHNNSSSSNNNNSSGASNGVGTSSGATSRSDVSTWWRKVGPGESAPAKTKESTPTPSPSPEPSDEGGPSPKYTFQFTHHTRKTLNKCFPSHPYRRGGKPPKKNKDDAYNQTIFVEWSLKTNKQLPVKPSLGNKISITQDNNNAIGMAFLGSAAGQNEKVASERELRHEKERQYAYEASYGQKDKNLVYDILPNLAKKSPEISPIQNDGSKVQLLQPTHDQHSTTGSPMQPPPSANAMTRPGSGGPPPASPGKPLTSTDPSGVPQEIPSPTHISYDEYSTEPRGQAHRGPHSHAKHHDSHAFNGYPHHQNGGFIAETSESTRGHRPAEGYGRDTLERAPMLPSEDRRHHSHHPPNDGMYHDNNEYPMYDEYMDNIPSRPMGYHAEDEFKMREHLSRKRYGQEREHGGHYNRRYGQHHKARGPHDIQRMEMEMDRRRHDPYFPEHDRAAYEKQYPRRYDDYRGNRRGRHGHQQYPPNYRTHERYPGYQHEDERHGGGHHLQHHKEYREPFHQMPGHMGNERERQHHEMYERTNPSPAGNRGRSHQQQAREYKPYNAKFHDVSTRYEEPGYYHSNHMHGNSQFSNDYQRY